MRYFCILEWSNNKPLQTSSIDSMRYISIIITFLLFPFLSNTVHAQLNSFDIGISSSVFHDTKYDQEYDYEFAKSAEIFYLTVGAQFNISSKFALTPRFAYSWNLQNFSKPQTSFGSGTIKDMTFIQKSKTLNFFKSGVALTYWINNSGKGFFLEGELQGLFNLSANSEEIKFIGLNSFEEYTVDFKEKVKPFVPSLRLGFGYRLGVFERLSIYFLIGKEIRVSSFYTNRKEYQIFNTMSTISINYKI